MPCLPGHFVPQLEQTDCHAADRALSGARRGAKVRADVAREVEATLGWRVDRGRDADRRQESAPSDGCGDAS